MFPIYSLFGNFRFDGYDEHLSACLNFDEENEFHKHVKHGCTIFTSLILSLSKETNIDHVFPQYDLSIFE